MLIIEATLSQLWVDTNSSMSFPFKALSNQPLCAHDFTSPHFIVVFYSLSTSLQLLWKSDIFIKTSRCSTLNVP